MRNNAIIWKISVVIVGIFFYFMLLVYVSSKQSDYKVILSTEKEEYLFDNDGSVHALEVNIKNNSNRTLGSAPEFNIFLSYHLYDSMGNLISYENERCPLEANIFAHSKGKSGLLINPLETGEYIVEIDLIEEGVAWFSDFDGSLCKIKLNIK